MLEQKYISERGKMQTELINLWKDHSQDTQIIFVIKFLAEDFEKQK